MLSPADMLIIGAVALIAFGPDQLPKVARRAGQVVRDVQNTSASFIREMERAADEAEYVKTEAAPTPDYYTGTYAEPTPAPGITAPGIAAPGAAAPGSSASGIAAPGTAASGIESSGAPATGAHMKSEPGKAGFAHEDSSGI